MHSSEMAGRSFKLLQSPISQQELNTEGKKITSIAWTDEDDQDSDNAETAMSGSCSFCCGIIIGSLVCAIGLGVLLTFKLSPKPSKTSIVTNIFGSTMIKMTYTTVTTTSVSTSTSSTSTTTSVTTSSSTTTSTSTTTSVTTSSSTTTSTSRSTSSTTRTTTTTTASTTTTSNRCNILRWNTTGKIVAGGVGVSGSAPDRLDKPRGIYIDSNDILYICDSENHRIQKWIIGATTGTTVAGNSNGLSGSGSTGLNRPNDVTFDQNGYMYVVDKDNHRVQAYAPNSTIGNPVAGTGNLGITNNQLSYPECIAIDESSNLYITDTGNNRVMKWTPNATTGTVLISSTVFQEPYGIIVKNGSTNQVYIGDRLKDNVQLWAAGATQPNQTLAGVSVLDLDGPRAIRFDPYDNLYVADYNNGCIKKFCAGSTTPIIIIDGGNTSPFVDRPAGIAFDSNYNLYVSDSTKNYVVKFSRL